MNKMKITVNSKNILWRCFLLCLHLFTSSDLKFSVEDGSEKAMNVYSTAQKWQFLLSLVYALASFRIENFNFNGMGGFDSFSLQIACDNLV